MKNIIIKESNKEKIEKALKEVEGRATARTVDFGILVDAVRELEKKYFMCTKKSLIGSRFLVDPNRQEFPKAYKYKPESTHVEIIMEKSGWALSRADRNECTKNFLKFVYLSQEAEEKIKEYYGF